MAANLDQDELVLVEDVSEMSDVASSVGAKVTVWLWASFGRPSLSGKNSSSFAFHLALASATWACR